MAKGALLKTSEVTVAVGKWVGFLVLADAYIVGQASTDGTGSNTAQGLILPVSARTEAIIAASVATGSTVLGLVLKSFDKSQ